MPLSRRMVKNPLTVKGFLINYYPNIAIAFDAIAEYKKYLRTNELGHHYSPFDTMAEWCEYQVNQYKKDIDV